MMSPRWKHAVLVLWLAPLLEFFVTVEWSLPYCNNQMDGPGNAGYGFPFPYMDYAGNSLEYGFVPWLYLLNLLVYAAIVHILLRSLSRATWFSRIPKIALRTVMGLLLLMTSFAAVMGWSYWHPMPVSSLGYADVYWDYRPVGIDFGARRYHCAPSVYWFGPVRTPGADGNR